MNLCTKKKQSQTQRTDLWLRDGKDGLEIWHSVQSLSPVWLFVTPWTASHQASLFIANSWSLLKLMSIKLVMPFGISRCKLLHIEWIKHKVLPTLLHRELYSISCIKPLNGKEYIYICANMHICEYTYKLVLYVWIHNKASGSDGIPVELFQILKDDAVKVRHSICQQIWKTQQWPLD